MGGRLLLALWEPRDYSLRVERQKKRANGRNDFTAP
jgi:hypothetical protein